MQTSASALSFEDNPFGSILENLEDLTAVFKPSELHPAVRPGLLAPPAWKFNKDNSTNHRFKILTADMTSKGTGQQAASCRDAIAGLNLPSLPAVAISAIFSYLDCSSGLNLACTCSKYAAKFALHKQLFMQRCPAELTPIVSLDEATSRGRSEYSGPQP